VRAVSRRGALAALLAVTVAVAAGAQGRRRAAVLEIVGATPKAAVVVDGVRVGRTGADGASRIQTLRPGRYTVAVRQTGFADYRQPVTLAAGRSVSVTPKRVPVTDRATLAFQRAAELALDGKHSDAVPLYRDAIAARGGAYPDASIGLARSLLALKSTAEATAAAAAAIDAEPRNAEAHTVLANILRERGLPDDAVAEYRKAVTLASGRMPEAHTGLAILLDEGGKREQAVVEFRKAIEQNLDAEPILYQLLGATLEELERPKEAIAAYEQFLALAPDHSLASAVRSVLERLRAADEKTDEGDVNPYAPKP
jgi:Flp pilus assembly protein TadD